MIGRFLAIRFKALSLDRHRSVSGEGTDCAIIVRKENNVFQVVGAGAGAAADGIASGITLSQARARSPDIKVLKEDTEADQVLLERLARAMERYTPLVAIDGADGLLLDISGCAHLFGGEAAMVRDASRRLAAWGFESAVAVCGNPAAARALAHYGEGGVVPEGADFEAVEPLPVVALRLPDDGADVLSRLGLRTVGAVAAQPRVALARRFGSAVGDALDRLSGHLGEPISPLRPAVPMSVERCFAEPLIAVEGIVRVVAALRERLSDLMRVNGCGARRVCLGLFHADGVVHETDVGLSARCADASRLCALLSPRIEALSSRVETDSGIDLVRLSAPQTGPLLPVQEDMVADAQGSADLSALIDALSARFGPQRVRRIVPANTHQPEAAERRVSAMSGTRGGSWPQSLAQEPFWEAMGWTPVPRRPVRLFSPPEPVEALASVPDGPPVRFVWRRVAYRVAAAEGPERIAPEWWRETLMRSRDYFTVEDVNGRRFWLFREGLYGRETATPSWFVHGLFS